MPFVVSGYPNFGEYVGRPSPLGNPHVMRDESERDFVCDMYEQWFERQIDLQTPEVIEELERLQALGKNKTVRLACFCKGKRCHAETIARYLNLKEQEK